MKEINDLNEIQSVFFIGVAGTGMSAIAQYLAGTGKSVSGSDRYFVDGETNETRMLLERTGVHCFEQNGSGISTETDLVVVSTAIEDSVSEVKLAKSLQIPIMRRSELLALIAKSKKTIAVGGTSGKSTTSAMLFDIMKQAGWSPSIISGAGLVSIIREGYIGNAQVGKGEWLIIEADESDGSIVQYEPEVGLLLNIDKDHQEIDELLTIFETFKKNTKVFFVTNRSNALSAAISQQEKQDFSVNEAEAGFVARNFRQQGMQIQFDIENVTFCMNTVGRHNMENALAAVAVARQLGISTKLCADALAQYQGIFRRHQLLGVKQGVYVVDDYAHNPVKCAASIAACQGISNKVVAWFQPHGYGPTRFLKLDFIKEFTEVLRPQDELWMSEIFYAGGTAVKDISAKDLIDAIHDAGKNAFFVADREDWLDEVRSHLSEGCVLLLMGARDPSLESFAKLVYEKL